MNDDRAALISASELLTAEDLTALQDLAELLGARHAVIASTWAQRLIAVAPDLPAPAELVAGLNDQILQLVLAHCRTRAFEGLYPRYYEQMYELAQADLQFGRLPQQSLDATHASARISLQVIGEQPQVSTRMLLAYSKLAINLLMLADRAYADCYQAFFQRMQDLAAAANRRKDELLATLAHELRNPLSAIQNAVTVLGHDSSGVETGARALGVIDRQLSQITRLVNDLYELSRVMHGKAQFQRELVDLAAVLTTAVETAQPLIDAHGQRLTLSLPEGVVALHADPIRLVQIVSNLLSNAAKYTNRGGEIALTAVRHEDSVSISVSDTGIGIAPDMLPHVFERFVQGTAKGPQDGLGIGLMLVRALVAMHEGTVDVFSKGLGKGSTFVVTLPLGQPEL